MEARDRTGRHRVGGDGAVALAGSSEIKSRSGAPGLRNHATLMVVARYTDMKHTYALFALLLPACIDDLPARQCVTENDCVRSGMPGQCLPSPVDGARRWCAFSSDDCASKRRWGQLAGDGLASQCVGEASSDAAPYDAVPTIDGSQVFDASSDAGAAPPDAGPAQLIVDQDTHNFGSVRPDQFVMRTFTVTNTGGMESGPLDVRVTGTGAAAFTATATACQGNRLLPGVGCDIIVTFSTATQGTRLASLVVSATPGGTTMTTLEGAGLSPAALTSDPPTATFGTVTTGNSATIPLSIRNGGELATGTLTTTIDGPDAARFSTSADTCRTKPLAAASSCGVSVTFSPTSMGARTATLHVSDGTRSVDVPLGGTGVAPGALTLTSAAPTFADTPLGMSTSATVTVKNTGGTPFTGLTTSITGGAASDFSRNPDNCNGQGLAAGATCTVTIRFRPTIAGPKSASFSVTATGGGSASTSFVANATAHVSVMTAGEGSGTVSSTPVGLQCASGSSAGCAFDFAASSVLLTANPASNSVFDGWNGAGCSGTQPCTVQLSVARTVTATFSLRRYTITISKTGSGAAEGRVTSTSGAIDCGVTCSTQVIAGQSITLNAMDVLNSSTGASFQGWSGGGCPTAGSCVVTPSGDAVVTAFFKAFPRVNAIMNSQCFLGGCNENQYSAGRIVSSPSVFDLRMTPDVATVNILEGTVLQLTAIPEGTSMFEGWYIPPAQADLVAEYTLRFQNPRSITVGAGEMIIWGTFSEPITLMVNISGSGTITSIPGGIACAGPGTCSAPFGRYSGVLLRADRPGTWSGANVSCAAGTICEVFMSQSPIVNVSFP